MPPAVEETRNLPMALALGPRECVSLVGAGGKTSLMKSLSAELQARAMRVVSGTTTHVAAWEIQEIPYLFRSQEGPGWLDCVRKALRHHGHVFVGEGPTAEGKIQGIPPEEADRIYALPELDFLVLEADGAARLPAKAPAPHEPVIPASCTLVVALLGLETLTGPLDPDRVFRYERFRELTGLSQGQWPEPRALSRLFSEKNGLFKGSPEGCRRAAFLNKADLLGEKDAARRLARSILEGSSSVERVVIGSLLQGDYLMLRRD